MNVGNQLIYLNANQYINNYVESGAIINGYGLVTSYLLSGSNTDSSNTQINTTILVVNDTFTN